MTPDNLSRLESDLWQSADQLRANSKLNASEYSMPVLGLIFLRHAYNRFLMVKAKIEPTLPMRGGKRRDLTKEDFVQQSALFLPEECRFDRLLDLVGKPDLGKAIDAAMKKLEDDYPQQLGGALPRGYTAFDKDLLGNLIKVFNRESLANATGDVFGRIYEYFLNEFAKSGAQEGGEYFTPPSLVRTIVNVIEPDHGVVFDPACGSAGMFVQTGHFIEHMGAAVGKAVTFFGQEKSESNTKLARMNLAVHGMEGRIIQGNTFYEDNARITTKDGKPQPLVGQCDFVMANPPFNVDGVDPVKAKQAGRLPFGLPGLRTEKTPKGDGGDKTKAQTVSNANYLWMQYFYAYLNPKGRAGFVMASSASDADNKEREIREQLIATGHVDAIISIGTNFFYTRTLPCTLWFFDKGKPKDRLDQVLMIDARSIYRMVNRRIRDFSDEQLANLAAVTWLYRGQGQRFLRLVRNYLEATRDASASVTPALEAWTTALATMHEVLSTFGGALVPLPEHDGRRSITAESITVWREALAIAREDRTVAEAIVRNVQTGWTAWIAKLAKAGDLDANKTQHVMRAAADAHAESTRALVKAIEHQHKLVVRLADQARNGLRAGRDFKQALEQADAARAAAVDAGRLVVYWHHQALWLQERFPEARFQPVLGLCAAINRNDITHSDSSLNPGRFVGTAPVLPDEDGVIEERLEAIATELEELNATAEELSRSIQSSFAELLG